MRKGLLIVFFVSIFLSQISFALSQSDQYEVTDEEYAVYTALFGEKIKLVVIESPESKDNVEWIDRIFKESLSHSDLFNSLSSATIDNLISRNRHIRPLKNLFKTNVKCVILSRAELNEIFDNNPTTLREQWQQFYEKYPDSGGFYSFSRVGFNNEKTQALLFVGHFCGALCASGKWILLTKMEGKWVETTRHLVWVS